MDKRNAMRAGAVSAAATLMMLLSSPAFAAGQDGKELANVSTGEAIGLYVGIPVALFVIIAGLVMLGTAGSAKSKGK
ncbi:hypothetical protein ACQRUO_10915 [Kitasatospora sp. LaBMicrA B282]